MLKVVATALEDGWAFVRRGGMTILVRPPYYQSNVVAVSESAVERAISTQGFRASDKIFKDWPSLIRYLKDSMVAIRKEQGRDAPPQHTGLRLVPHAPLPILESYLDRVESELFPEQKWDAADALLVAMISADNVQNNQGLLKRCTQLLRQLRDLMKQDHPRAPIVDQEEYYRQHFPRATRKYGAEAISKRTREVAEDRTLLAA